MNIADYFAANYPQARNKFLQYSEQQGFAVTHHQHPTAVGPDGGDLFIDVATKGPTNAEQLLIMTSGTHGVEGYCGSGIQAALLGEGELAVENPNLRIVLIHAVNPYGFAHDRRVNEDNVDLNRNFLDFANQQPRDNGYGDVHEHLVPQQWQGSAREAADTALADYAKTKGATAFQQAASGGQYTHPDGVFYGGQEPSWSAATLISLIKTLAADAKHINLIDYHTGLGPYGHGEIINVGSPAQVARGFAFYPQFELTDPDAGTSSSAPVQGTIAHGVERALPGVDTVFVALEYGTLSMRDVMTAVRADNWLYQYGQVDSELGRSIKRQIRDAFYCDEPEWKQMVYQRALEVVQATLHKLSD